MHGDEEHMRGADEHNVRVAKRALLCFVVFMRSPEVLGLYLVLCFEPLQRSFSILTIQCAHHVPGSCSKEGHVFLFSCIITASKMRSVLISEC